MESRLDDDGEVTITSAEIVSEFGDELAVTAPAAEPTSDEEAGAATQEPAEAAASATADAAQPEAGNVATKAEPPADQADEPAADQDESEEEARPRQRQMRPATAAKRFAAFRTRLPLAFAVAIS